jgi:diguanylate cyclase (GGDEF)-like protein
VSAPRSSLDLLREIIDAQREIMAAGPDLDLVLRIATQRTQHLLQAAASIVELREGDEMVYRAASGTASAAVGLRLNVASSLSGVCATTGKTVGSRDTEDDPRVDREACRRLGIRSMLIAPLQYRGAVTGVLKVTSAAPDAFDAEQQSTLTIMAGFIGAATAHAREHEDHVHMRNLFESAFDHAAIGMALVSLNGHWLKVNDALCRTLGYARDELLALDFQTITHPQDLAADLDLSLARDLTGAPLFFTSQVQDITRRKQLEGELQRAAELDPLTGLYNRRQLGLFFERASSAPDDGPISCLVMDMDHFKLFNDTHGHALGDQVLRAFAQVLREQVRTPHVVGRWGGEEFVAVLPGANREQALQLAERIRCACSEITLDGKDRSLRPSVSIGVAVGAVGEATGALIEQADRALYVAKSDGRNCVRIASRDFVSDDTPTRLQVPPGRHSLRPR